MAIINVHPDSFSDGGRFADPDAAVRAALRALEAGAEILDIGGESTRPDAKPVSADEEQARVLPVIAAIARQSRAVISVDTYRAETARLAVHAGAHIVNDVHGLQREPAIAAVAAETGAGLCIMHTGRDREKLSDVIEDQFHFLERSLQIAADAGVARERVVLDPGFGFAKDTNENLELMARFRALPWVRRPLLVGTSRKRFVGAVTAERRKTATSVPPRRRRSSELRALRFFGYTMSQSTGIVSGGRCYAGRKDQLTGHEHDCDLHDHT